MTTQEVQVAHPSIEEYDEMILLSDHEQIVKDLKAEYETKIEHLNGVIAKLEAWGNGLQVKLASLSQELFRLKNLYPDMSNIFKGLAKWSPDSFKNAIMIVDYLWAQYQSVWLMYKRAHEKKKRPMWQWVALVMFGAIVFGGWLGYLENPAEAGGALASAAPYLAIVAVAMLIAFIWLRRRSEAKATKPQ